MSVRARALVAVLLISSSCSKSNPTGPSDTAGPRVLYVSPAGSNSDDGSSGRPWKTLRYAVAQLRAGDTLLLKGGTYTGGENTIDSQLGTVPSGSSWSNPITISGAPSESVTVEPPDGLEAIRLTVSAPHYLIFQDFVVDMAQQTHGPENSGPNAVFISNGAHHNRFQRLEVKNNTSTGFMFADTESTTSPFNEVLNCSIHDNGRYPGINKGYGAYVFSSDNIFDGNDVYSNGGYGLHFYSNHGPLNVSRNEIRNNRIHDNGTHGGTNYGVVIAWGDGNRVYQNAIFRNAGGVLVYTNSSNTQVYGNNIYDNSPLEGILIQYATSANVRDNVLSGNAFDIVDLGIGTQLSR